jgi:membrane associated rhomboid family serine protease
MLPLWDTQPRRRLPVLTLCLLAANLGVFAYELWLRVQGRGALELFIDRHGFIPTRILAEWKEPQAWLTVVTSMFLHGSGAHLLGNAWFLWIFGASVEGRIGPGRFLGLYVMTGLGAAVLQGATDLTSGVPMIGASGAISGVLGAYFVLFPRAWIVTLVPWIVPILPVPAFVFLILWFVLQTTRGVGSLLDGPAIGGVAWWAHIGGFLAGVVLIRWLGTATKKRRR